MEHEETQSNTDKVEIQKILSVLFYLAEPISFKRLASLFETDSESIEKIVEHARGQVESCGLSLVIHDGEVQLVTHPTAHSIIEKLRKDELSKELSKATVETLSVILYKDNVSRSDIDFIRGVNSSFTLRNLLVRGLIVRKSHPTDARTYVYTASHELLAYLGVTKTSELPDYERVRGLLEEKVEGLIGQTNEE